MLTAPFLWKFFRLQVACISDHRDGECGMIPAPCSGPLLCSLNWHGHGDQDYIAGRLPLEREALAELLAPEGEPSEVLQGLVRAWSRLVQEYH